MRVRRQLTLSIALALAVSAGLAACGDDDDADDSAVGSAVAIADFSFSPGEIDVAVGGSVEWTNEDSAAHTVTFLDGSADSGNLADGATFSHTFDTAGEYDYRCNIHSSMTGTVRVA